MAENNTDWLREHMREHIAQTTVADSSENILNFQGPRYSAKNPGAAALDLVYQAVELIGDVDSYAAERQSRAELLAQQAVEKLKIADDRVRAAESAQRAAEAAIVEVHERIEREFSAKLQKIEQAMEQTASNMAAAEIKLTAAEQTAKAAELRAEDAENVLRRIEETLRTQILDKRFVGLRKNSVKAA